MKNININGFVKVRLTPKGVDVYYHQFDELNEKLKCRGVEKPIERCMPQIDENGLTEMQFHHLMNIYGEYMTPGRDNVFVDNRIYFNDKDLLDFGG